MASTNRKAALCRTTAISAKRQGRKPHVFALGAPSAGGAPVLTVTSTPTTKKDPMVVALYDDTPGLRTHMLWCRIGGANGGGMLVHDGTSFWPGFFLHSTRTGAGSLLNPYIFTIYRDYNWPEGVTIDIYVRAVDQSGNLLDT